EAERANCLQERGTQSSCPLALLRGVKIVDQQIGDIGVKFFQHFQRECGFAMQLPCLLQCGVAIAAAAQLEPKRVLRDAEIPRRADSLLSYCGAGDREDTARDFALLELIGDAAAVRLAGCSSGHGVRRSKRGSQTQIQNANPNTSPNSSG